MVLGRSLWRVSCHVWEKDRDSKPCNGKIEKNSNRYYDCGREMMGIFFWVAGQGWLEVTFWALSGRCEGMRLLCQVLPVWEETWQISDEYLLDNTRRKQYARNWHQVVKEHSDPIEYWNTNGAGKEGRRQDQNMKDLACSTTTRNCVFI